MSKMRKMKDSGIEWIGEIPEEWEIKRLKAVLCERNESNNPIKTDYILSLTNDRGVIPYDEKGDVGNKSKEDVSGYKIAYPNDIVLNSMNVIIGSVALSKYYGCVSPVYYMLYLRNPEDNIRYYNYIFQTKEFQSKLKGYGNGIMEIRMRIQMLKLNTVDLPIADFDTQHRIADYLDDKCGKIDRYIETQRAIIEKLKAYKQAVITEAVTKGLDPTASRKDSGVEWIGEIPQGWNITTLKYLISFIESGVSVNAGQEEAKEGEFGVLKTSCVSKYVFDIHENKSVNFDEMNRVKCPVRKNTIIVSRMNTPELVGACAYVEQSNDTVFLPDRLWQVHFSSNVNVKYVWYFLRSEVIRAYYASLSTGTSSSMQNISQSQFNHVFVVLPEMNTQKEIIHYLDRITAEINRTIQKNNPSSTNSPNIKNPSFMRW